jgi:RNA polymerase sigma-70 factor (ECF subfamily)
MSHRSWKRVSPLTVVADSAFVRSDRGHQPIEAGVQAPARDLDWSILMARAQSGDDMAYRRLLEDIAPYLRSLAARRHRDASDVEDSVQDILLTLHAIRHAYDPARPFGPWLVTIANRRIIDRLRRQARSRKSRETLFEAGYETFSAPQANLQETELEGHSLRKAVERLPDGQRRAIQLLKLEEMSLKEAASVSGMSVASLKVATHRALKSLRKMLRKRSDAT